MTPNVWKSLLQACGHHSHSVWRFAICRHRGPHSLLHTHTERRKRLLRGAPLPVWVYVAPGRQAVGFSWHLCAGFNLGSGLNTRGMFLRGPSAGCSSFSYTTPLHPPMCFLCVSQAKKCSPKWSQIPWSGMGGGGILFLFIWSIYSRQLEVFKIWTMISALGISYFFATINLSFLHSYTT